MSSHLGRCTLRPSQVVEISNLTLYFAYRGRLFLFHERCLMDINNQLSPVNLTWLDPVIYPKSVSSIPGEINPNILRKILLTCTSEVPFYHHVGNIYTQKDSVFVEPRSSVISTCPTLKIAYFIRSKTFNIPWIYRR